MALTIPVEEKILSEAEFGLFFMREKLTKKKSEELKEAGFDVRILEPKTRLYYINWLKSAVNCDDVTSLDETSDKYTLSQKAWIISRKCNISIVDYLNNKKKQV